MALFVGGPLDGKLIDIDPSRENVEVAIQKPLSLELIKINKENKPTKTLTDVFYYKREIVSCPSRVYVLFVPRSFSCEDVIDSLIEGYHQSAIQNTSI